MIRSMVSKMIRSMITTVINPFDGLISRYFVTLDPVLNSYYEMAAPITFSGDFEVEVEFSKGAQGSSYNILIGDSSGSSFYISTRTDYIEIAVGGTSLAGVIPVLDRKLHLAKLTRVGSLVSLYVDGVADGTINNTGVVNLDQIGRNFFGNYFNGIIANVKFTDKSGANDIVTTFKLDNSPAAANYIYGGEEVVNGDFSNGATGWSLDSGWSIANNKAINDGSGYTYIKQDGGLTIGSFISITFEIKDYISGSVRFQNSVDPISQNFSGNGYHTILVSNLLSPNLRFQAALFNGSIDNVSVKEITNYTEANAASDIEYSQENVFGAEEVVNGDFANGTANWLSNGTSILSVVNGVMEIDRNEGQQFNQCYQDITTIIGKNYIFNADIIYESNSINIYIDGVVAAEQWGGASLFFTATSTTTEIGIYPSYSTAATAKIDNVSVKEITNAVEYKNIPQTARELYSFEDDIWTGSNELVVNGDFATDSDWVKSAGWTISNGLASASVEAFRPINQSIPLIAGATYTVTYDIVSFSAGAVRVILKGGDNLVLSVNSSVGTYTENFTARIGNNQLNLQSHLSGFTGSIDNVSVKEVIEVAS